MGAYPSRTGIPAGPRIGTVTLQRTGRHAGPTKFDRSQAPARETFQNPPFLGILGDFVSFPGSGLGMRFLRAPPGPPARQCKLLKDQTTC